MEKLPAYGFNTNPRFPLLLLYVRCKSRVTFVQRCFRDVIASLLPDKHQQHSFYGEIFNFLSNTSH